VVSFLPPSVEELTEYFDALAVFLEKDYSLLTLTLQLKEVENLPHNVNNE
jgi:hypothetical protein